MILFMACFGFVKVNCNEHKQPFSQDAVKQRLFDVQWPGDPEKIRLRTWLNPSNPEICASSHYECVWVTLDSTHLLDSKSNIQSLCMLDGFQDFVIWETHMRLALKLIELCGMRTSTSTRLLGSANVAPGCRYKLIYTKINISGYRPWQYHTQTLKGESVARKTCKDQ